MLTNGSSDDVSLPAKIGAWLFALWGVLHVWVGAEGVRQYLTGGTSGLWNMLIGGSAVPRAAFVHATEPATLFAQGQLILNFCIDVGGYGVLSKACLSECVAARPLYVAQIDLSSVWQCRYAHRHAHVQG